MVDGILRDEQVGFRKWGGYSNQIFIVRHLMQQANKMKVPLSLCFVDFEKALDSISRRTMGKIMRHMEYLKSLLGLI